MLSLLIRVLLGLSLTIAGGALSAAPPSGLPKADPDQNGVSSDRLQQITAMLQQHVDDGLIAGAVAGVARHGKVVYLESMGWQDVEAQVPMQDNSIFQIRSMSKAITSLAALRLHDQGRLNLDDPVSKYIPSYGNMFVLINPDEPFLSAERRPTRQITVRDLILNTSGLSSRSSALYQQRRVRSRSDKLEEFVQKMSRVPLVSNPGERFVYSESISVLGRVIEIATGLALDEYLQQQVFTPLEMVDTGFYVPGSKHDRHTLVYRVPDEDAALTVLEPMEIPITEKPPLLEGAIGMVSTVPDYLRFYQTLLNGGELDGARVVQVGTAADMTVNQVPEELFPFGVNPERPMLDRGWGYGLAVVMDASKSSYSANNGEFGWSGTLGTTALADPSTGTVAILMMQVQPSSAHGLANKFKDLVYSAVDDNQ